MFKNMINNVLNCDCYEEIKHIPDDSIDLIIIDPPYEYVTGGKNNFVAKRPFHSEMYSVAKKTYRQNDDKIKSRKEIEHLSYGIDYSILDELDRVMKKINIYIWCSKRQVGKILSHYESKGCNIDILTWHKDNVLPTANNTYLNDTEYCIFAREKGVKVFGNYETKNKYYVTHTNLKDKELYKHPTIKPLNIVKNLIINSSCENDIVLDCFCGSGTTCVAAKELNRKFVGMEINKEYCEIAKKRINGITADGQMSIFTDFTKEV